jgi:hypothetical protein
MQVLLLLRRMPALLSTAQVLLRGHSPAPEIQIFNGSTPLPVWHIMTPL